MTSRIIPHQKPEHDLYYVFFMDLPHFIRACQQLKAESDQASLDYVFDNVSICDDAVRLIHVDDRTTKWQRFVRDKSESKGQ